MSAPTPEEIAAAESLVEPMVSHGTEFERGPTINEIALRYRELVAAVVARAERAEAALKRARDWGINSKGFSGRECVNLADWVDAGMTGPLPELPDYMREYEHAAGVTKGASA